jgi:hypothetical protein
MQRMRIALTSLFRGEKRERGESLMGTMVGVLLLSVILSAFAGIFLGVSKSSNVAKETSARLTLVTTYNAQALSDGRVDSSPQIAPGGWALEVPNSAYSYGITRYAGDSSTIAIHQWGINTNGIITVYTAMAKTGNDPSVVCDSNLTPAQLSSQCVVAFGSTFSSKNPPSPGSTGSWQNYVNVESWNSGQTYDSTTAQNFTNGSTFSLNSVEPAMTSSQTRTLKFVVDFNNTSSTTRYIQINTNNSSVNKSFVVPVGTGTGYYYGTVQIPGDETAPTVTIGGASATPSVNNFIFYTSKAS